MVEQESAESEGLRFDPHGDSEFFLCPTLVTFTVVYTSFASFAEVMKLQYQDLNVARCLVLDVLLLNIPVISVYSMFLLLFTSTRSQT